MRLVRLTLDGVEKVLKGILHPKYSCTSGGRSSIKLEGKSSLMH